MNTNIKHYLLKGIFLSSILGISNFAYAGKLVDVLNECQYQRLVTNMVDPGKFGSKNTTICVDVPVDFNHAKMVFDLDTESYDSKGNAIGLKHIVMIGTMIRHKIKRGLIKPNDVSIVGVLHGAALPWALKTASERQHKWMDRIFNLNNAGVNIQLEVCGVTLDSHGWTKKDLYSYEDNGEPDLAAAGRIYVNRGSLGREIVLQQRGYTYIHEGHIAKN